MKEHHHILHDEKSYKFYTKKGEKESYLVYDKPEFKTLEYQKTFVPKELRGMGISQELAGHALNYAKNMGFKVRPTCPVVEKFINEHPEYKEVVA